MKVLVTGAAGFLGSILVTKLALNPELEVIAVDDCSRQGFDLLQSALDKERARSRIRLMRADFTDSEAISPILNEIEGGAIIHCGALPDERLCTPDPAQCVRTNILGTYRLTVSKLAGPRIFIFASSQAVYGYPEKIPVSEESPLRPVHLYSVTKSAGEDLVKILNFRKNVAVVILRFSSIYGYGLFSRWNEVTGIFVKNALERGSIRLLRPINLSEHGAQVIDFIHVLDVCDAILSALDFALNHQSCLEVFNIGGGQGVSIAQLAEIVSRLVKDRFGKIVNVEREIRNEPEVPKMIFNISKAQRLLNWRPKVSIEEGITDLITKYAASSHSV